MPQRITCIFTILLIAFVVGFGHAASPSFPSLGAVQSVRGELTSVDFIHRTGQFRTGDGALHSFTMPPFAIMTYRGTESDLRDVPLGTQFDFLLLPDEEGRPTQLVGTRHEGAFDAEQQQKFIRFTQARGLAGWIERTEGRQVAVTFFSGTPQHFDACWGDAFVVGADVTICAANDELRTWQPTSCGERGTIVAVEQVPAEGIGCSGRRVVVQVTNMLEGFRPGRVVRIFGAGWKVRNQLYQECLINYGYSARRPPEFQECMARQYPELFPYRTDFSNRHLSWFQLADGDSPPAYAEHLMFGDLTAFDAAAHSGEFQVEGTGELVRFALVDTGTRSSSVRVRQDNFEVNRTRLTDLALHQRYRFHMFQDAQGKFNRCTLISDDFSHATLNFMTYQIQRLDLERGRIEVTWQGEPIRNYQKDIEIPPPYGRSLLRVVPETRVWKAGDTTTAAGLRIGDHLKFNQVSELPSRPSYCTDLWVIENPGLKPAKR